MIERLQSARKGNPEALEWARERYCRRAHRWVCARLPKYLRHSLDIEQCIADAFAQALDRLDSLHGDEGTFQLGLRDTLQTGIRKLNSEMSRDRSEEGTVTMEDLQSPLERAIGPESCDLYESALHSVCDLDRGAIVGRIEFGFGYRELAEMLGKPTPEAARAAVAGAVARLVEVMCHER